MRFRITFKSPDAVHDAIQEAARDSLPEGLEQDEEDSLLETRKEKISEAISRFVKWGEYVTVEFDTEAGTATAVPCEG